MCVYSEYSRVTVEYKIKFLGPMCMHNLNTSMCCILCMSYSTTAVDLSLVVVYSNTGMHILEYFIGSYRHHHHCNHLYNCIIAISQSSLNRKHTEEACTRIKKQYSNILVDSIL